MKPKRILSLLISLMTILSLLPANIVFADSIFDGGSGTENDPYQIRTLEQLEAFRDDVNTTKNIYSDSYFKLTADIDMSEKYNSLTGISWTPIGDWSTNDAFRFNGTFDGNGFEIKNLYINDEKASCRALFGYVDAGSTVKNLGVSGIVKGDEGVGGIVGANYGKILNCHNSAAISGRRAVGGIAGGCGTEGIYYCYNTGTVEGTEEVVGGITATGFGPVYNCYNIGTIKGNCSYVGGIVGKGHSFDIKYCYNAGSIISDNNDAGSITGLPISNLIAITNCYYLDGTAKSGVVGTDVAGQVEKISAEQMKNSDTFENWDFVETWEIGGDLKPRPILYSNSEAYIISTLAELEAFRDDTNLNGQWHNRNVKLTADIDMSEKYNADTGNSWRPISNYSDTSTIWKFYGTFDGNGHEIKNLYINAEDTDYMGLFGYVGGTVKNLRVSGSVKGRNGVGGIASVNEGTILNCSNAASISGKINVGGIVSYSISADAGIYCCYNTGTVEGIEAVGGVSGNGYSKLYNSYNTGEIKGSNIIGGIAGGGENFIIKNCYNIGNVSGEGELIGGVIGSACEAVENCYYLKGTAGGGISGQDENGKAESISVAQMNSAETFSAWDFTRIWEMSNVFENRPILKYNHKNVFSSADGSQEDPYTISNRMELEILRNSVNNGNDYEGKYIKLAENIDLNGTETNQWTSIGTTEKPFKGTFDGNGKTISGLYILATDNNQGLFGVVTGGTLKNFTVNGDITISATADKNVEKIGGAVGFVYNGVTVDGITSYVNISDTGMTANNNNCHIGGIVGCLGNDSGDKVSYIKNSCNYGNITMQSGTSTAGIVGISKYNNEINNCFNYGNITFAAENSKHIGGIAGDANEGVTVKCCINYGDVTSGGADCIGGVVAYANKNTKIENCANVGTVTCTNENGGFIGGVLGYINNDSFGSLADCYNYGKIISNSGSANHPGAVVGWCRNSNVSMFKNNYWRTGSCSAASGGKAIPDVYEKTDDDFKSGEIAWRLNGMSADGIWKQTLGENGNAYPNFKGEIVYAILENCSAASAVDYSNTVQSIPNHTYNEKGICTPIAGENHYKPADLKDGVYEISNIGNLIYFAQLVNGVLKDTEQNQSAKAVLVNDIDMSGISDFVPIGGTTGLYYESESTDKGYCGEFDGNGHVIKNLSIKGSDSAELTYGVFGTLSGTVKNLGVENFTFTVGTKDCRTGGIAGQILSAGSVTNCYTTNSKITATSKVAGGIAGCNYAGKIANCYTYNVTVTAYRTGGIVGDNCADKSDNIRKGTISNCYTDADTVENSQRAGNVENSLTGISTEEFVSGKITYLLNGNTSDGIWGQKIGTDKLPVLNGEKVETDVYNNENVYRNKIDGFKILMLGADSKSAAVVLGNGGTYTIVFADYEDGKLLNVKTVNVTVEAAQAVRVTSAGDFTLGTGDKVMVWKDVSNITPLCETYIVK